MKRHWKIAVLANIKDDNHPKPEGVPPDAFAYFDHIETIDLLRAALETDGDLEVGRINKQYEAVLLVRYFLLSRTFFTAFL